MNNDKEIYKKLEEELEGYDEAVVLKIRRLAENVGTSEEDDYRGCVQEDYDIPLTD